MKFQVRLVDREVIRSFIEQHHYSGSINGCLSTYHFGLYDEAKLIGAMFYGQPAMRNQWKKYVEKESDIIELRRLCCIDDTPRNTESYFIGKTLRWLEKNTSVKKVISYADSNYGHVGTIYKASNFTYLGTTSIGKVIILNGKKYHDKTIRTKYNGKLKPFAQKVKDALDNKEAFYQTQKPKHIYVYELKRRRKNINALQQGVLS